MTEMLGIQGISKEKLTRQPNINLKAACLSVKRPRVQNPMPGPVKEIEKDVYNITQTINLKSVLICSGRHLAQIFKANEQ